MPRFSAPPLKSPAGTLPENAMEMRSAGAGAWIRGRGGDGGGYKLDRDGRGARQNRSADHPFRYTELQPVGMGAFGLVWYVSIYPC